MKRFFQILILPLVIFACEPMEDVYDELDEANTGLSRDITFTLSEDDYELSGIEAVAEYGNFSSEDDVKVGVPNILAEKYPQFGQGSSAIVSYDYYNGGSPYLSTGGTVTVTDADYDELGYNYGNFDDLGADLPIFAAYKYPDARNGDYYDVTHDYYNGSFTENDVVSRVVKTAPYGWMYVTELDPDSYQDFFGERFANFSNTDEAEDKIPVYLPTVYPFAEEGDVLLMQYVYYDGGVIEDLAHFTFDGSSWLLYGDNFQITEESISLAHDGVTWVPDNTIKLTLGFNDYQWIGNEWASRNSGGSASVLQYSNFDLTLWSDDQIFTAITEWLVEEYPASEEGQKYLVTYATWEPGAGQGSIYVILEGGEYVTFE